LVVDGFEVLVHDDPDGMWAEVPALPGCFAADSERDLAAAVAEAILLCTS
jgi:predicted RNase H-like HicB family nuclease